MKRGFSWDKAVFLAVLVTLVGSAAYSLLGVLSAPSGAMPALAHGKVRGDYLLTLLQCLLGILLVFLPSMIQKRLHVALPGGMSIVFVVFLYAAIYLGEIRSFYDRFPHWDLVLHTFSGLMLGALGFSVVSLLNDSDRVKVSLSPLFMAVFAFCFAAALGVLWEIYEFSVDGLLGLNMQRFAVVGGAPLVGREALSDTMEDLIVDCLGALVISTAGYFSEKHGKGLVERLAMRRTGPS